MQKTVWLGAMVTACMAQSFAWASTSTASSATKLEKSDKVVKESTEITNPEMRAEVGSLSRLSVKASFSYYGAPVGRMLDENQPNPDNSPGVYKTSMNGSTSLRYRLNRRSSVGAGTGLSALTPFHGVQRVDMKTPYAYWDYFRRFGALQTSTSFSGSVTTVPNYREVGQVGGLSLSEGVKYRIGTTRMTLGLKASLSWFLYNRGYEVGDGNASNYYIGLYPSFEYRLSDRFVLSTSVAQGFRSLRKEDDLFALDRRTLSQRLGLGTVITKEIYFYPYLNFYPQDFSWKTTTLSFNTTFSVF